ncbi:hypothetical protein L6164_036570 [Bauhinia variegata]|uniref:Uncharacterized protein n=1 Tax=Bauhinia variegata TaxID=167791 RepID=A0ACB9KHE2_BAUVA|nr:hypothetical protein L6164_036570 [Bauhinia variegata]
MDQNLHGKRLSLQDVEMVFLEKGNSAYIISRSFNCSLMSQAFAIHIILSCFSRAVHPWWSCSLKCMIAISKEERTGNCIRNL